MSLLAGLSQQGVTAASITDASASGKAVLTGTPAQGREAIGAICKGTQQHEAATYYSAIGDSITLATNGSVTSSAYGFAELIAAATGKTLWNKGVSGAEVADIYTQVAGTSDNNKSLRTVLVGANDSSKRGTGAINFFKSALRAALVRLAVPYARVIAYNNDAVAYTGGWTGVGVFGGNAKKSAGAGSTATADVVGTSAYVGLVVWNSVSYPTEQVVQVEVDGVVKFSGALPRPSYTNYIGLTYGPVSVRINGLTEGTHTIKVSHIAGDVNLGLMWFAGSGQAGDSYPDVVCVATLSNYGGSAFSKAYNMASLEVFREVMDDDLNIKYVDVYGVISGADMADALHPNNAGHRKIADAIGLALGVSVPRSYPTAAAGLPVNSVWCDAANGNVLKVVL